MKVIASVALNAGCAVLPFLTAYDPLGALQSYGSLADLLLPGVTTITTRSRYLSMLCAALANAESLRSFLPGAPGLAQRRVPPVRRTRGVGRAVPPARRRSPRASATRGGAHRRRPPGVREPRPRGHGGRHPNDGRGRRVLGLVPGRRRRGWAGPSGLGG